MTTIDSSLLLTAAAEAAGAQQYPKGTLYVVATPIGNLADLSLRAIHLLSLTDAVACEDTRVTAGLLRHLGLHKPLIPVHEHNESEAAPALVSRLQAGERVALVSDAGTPAISDPGARVVHAVRAAGLRVVPLPGASAVATAVSAAGDGLGQGFEFVGFLPSSGKARETAVDALLRSTRTTACFEAPHRIESLLLALAAAGERPVTVCRELTKQFEDIHTAAAASLPQWLAADPNHGRGEFVVVLHARPERDGDDRTAADALLHALLPLMPLKQAVAIVATHSGVARNALYERALAWKAEQGQA